MNLRFIAFAILTFNMCHVPLIVADKVHHHHSHHLTQFLANATYPQLVSEVIKLYDENECLKEDNAKLTKGMIPRQFALMGWSAAGGAAGLVLLYAAVKVYCNS